jgi:UDP-glucose 4-epimerase
MKVLITGGSGFIGRAVVKALTAARHDITIFDLVIPNYAERVHLFIADILQNNILESFDLAKPDVVIHLAGCTDPTAGAEHLFKVNVRGTANVVNACIESGVKRIIFASTGMVYGKNSDLEVPEDTEIKPTSLYAFTKAVGESLVRASGLDHIIFRMFNVAGPGFRHDPPRYLIPKALAATASEPLRIFNGLNDIRDYIHVEDVALAYVKAIESGASNETYNLGTGIPTSLRHVLNDIADEKSAEVPTTLDMDAPGLNKQDGVNLTADATKARRVLGWRPERNLGDIVRDSYEWWTMNIGSTKQKGIMEYAK